MHSSSSRICTRNQELISIDPVRRFNRVQKANMDVDGTWPVIWQIHNLNERAVSIGSRLGRAIVHA
jgi:hypothetical protein